MPELALSFCVGAGLSFLVSLVFYYFQIRKYSSKRYLTVQKNLKLLDLRWNDLEGRPENFQEHAEQKEIKKAKSTYLLFGIASVVLSWLGLFFLVLMWVSLKKLIKNRLENYIFSSEISEKELTAEQMRDFGLKLEGLGFDSFIFQAQADK